MTDIFNRFEVFEKVDQNLKQKIRLFHVFDDIKGHNVLFVTSDDEVFGLGQNSFGCCGLGHNSVVNEPQVIPELCHKNVKQFFIGRTFYLALNSNNQVFSWGRNDWGQLARDTCICLSRYMKPQVITQFKKLKVLQLSCGSSHSLALTSDGCVYGWGYNKYGQIGCGLKYFYNNRVVSPMLINYFTRYLIKSIYCSYHRSFAITSDGLVFSWGYNSWCQLGHDFYRNGCVFEPKLINLSNITSICSSVLNTYFLSNEGLIYFCGYFNDENNCESFQKLPKLLKSDKKFIGLHSIPNYKMNLSIATASTQESIFYLFVSFEKTNDRKLFDYYSNVCQMTPNTIELNENNEIIFTKTQNNFSNENRFNERFDVLFELGSGGFGTVVKVRDKCSKRITVIKKIQLQGNIYSINLFC